MITTAKGTKVTPRQKAKEIMWHKLNATWVWMEDDSEMYGMTEAEISKVEEQRIKLMEMLMTKLNADESLFLDN